ncbi:PIG-L deacetylase family protein [Heyndrickxia sp. NPDC080065]|uniref:PIG-L deacetylase family protein n=1 Tax=Heyndrickxia sp. NPDC080065 TaxID=3390568 RepID=UPI003CFC0D10
MLFLKLRQYIRGHVIEYVQGRERFIKQIEFIRGLYRYPSRMLGRKFPVIDVDDDTDVLVFAAHPDDDVLGLGTALYRHSLEEDNIKVVFITNGTGRGGESWNVKVSESIRKSNIRYREAVQALSLINIPKENIYCLGFPDGGTQRYLKNMSMDIQQLVQKLDPGRIYVHCMEGGHRDHDLTSFVVKTVCNKVGYSKVFEWTEYNPMQPLGAHDVNFLPTQSAVGKEIKINISVEERRVKRKMLACHQSQDVEQFFLQGEAIRKADISHLEMELFEHCQFPKRELIRIVDDFNKSLKTGHKNKYLYQVSD